MAMNFWEAQNRARRYTLLYIIVFVLITFAIACVAEWAMHHFAGEVYDPPLPYLGLGFLTITFLVAGFNYLQYKSFGGSYAAEAVGARLVNLGTTDPTERRLLNIVEELSLASSLPAPPVYIIPAEEINAFAAGLSPDNAIVAITEGALRKLNRDEIQGVIAHELGHVTNGDMCIGMRLAAMLMGFYFALYIGLRMLQFGGRSRDSKKGDPTVLAAVILIIAGALSWFAGSILKAMVSRQREYLADACSVQFTRNPSGIANALRKIADENVHDMPKGGANFSHMYLNDTSFFSRLFATHPPIEKRIQAIEGHE